MRGPDRGTEKAKGSLCPPTPQAVIQNPFSNGGSPAAEAVSGEARFAYFPASSVGDTTAVSVQTTDQSLQAGGEERKKPGWQVGVAAGPAGREAPATSSDFTLSCH